MIHCHFSSMVLIPNAPIAELQEQVAALTAQVTALEAADTVFSGDFTALDGRVSTLEADQPAFIVENTWIQRRAISGSITAGGIRNVTDLAVTITIPSSFADYFVRGVAQFNVSGGTGTTYFPCHLYAEATPGGSVVGYGGESTMTGTDLKTSVPIGFWVPSQAGDHDFYVYMGSGAGTHAGTAPIDYQLDLCRILDTDRFSFNTATFTVPA